LPAEQGRKALIEGRQRRKPAGPPPPHQEREKAAALLRLDPRAGFVALDYLFEQFHAPQAVGKGGEVDLGLRVFDLRVEAFVDLLVRVGVSFRVSAGLFGEAGGWASAERDP